MKITKLQRSVLRSDLKPVTKLTLLALTNIVDWHTWTGQTSYEVLVVETGLSLASVKRGIADLCKKNHIHKKRNGDHNGYRRNQYTINTDSLFAYLSKWNPKSKEEKEDIVSNRAVEIAQIDTITGSSRAVEMALVDTMTGSSRAVEMALVDTTNQPNNNQPNNQPNNNQPNDSVASDASKEVRRYPKGHFCEGAIIVDGDDWVPEKKTNNKQAWIDGGWTPPTHEEILKDYNK